MNKLIEKLMYWKGNRTQLLIQAIIHHDEKEVKVQLAQRANPNEAVTLPIFKDIDQRICIFENDLHLLTHSGQNKQNPEENDSFTSLEAALFMHSPTGAIVKGLLECAQLTPRAWIRAVQNLEREADRRLAALDIIPFGDCAPGESLESVDRFAVATEIVQKMVWQEADLQIMVPPTIHVGNKRLQHMSAHEVIDHLLKVTAPAITDHIAAPHNRAALRRAALSKIKQ